MSFPLCARYSGGEDAGGGAITVGANVPPPLCVRIADCGGEEEEYPEGLCVHPDCLRTTADSVSPLAVPL